MFSNIGEMFQRLALPSFILAVTGFTVMQFATYQPERPPEMQFNEGTLKQVFAGAPHRRVVYAWPELPTQVFLDGTWSEEAKHALDEVLLEINDAARQIVVETTQSSKDAKFHLVLSDEGHREFEDHYAAFFQREFGMSQFKVWDQIGGFSFPYSPNHPAFGILLFDPIDVEDTEYVDLNTPPFAMISVGSVSGMPMPFFKSLLREELAHVVFFIPDFVVADGTDSIFNANLVPNDREDFSQFDRQLMAFLATHARQNMPIDKLFEIAFHADHLSGL